jgi:integrase
MARRSVSSLSRAFAGLVRKAGIPVEVREGRRRTSSKTFHGLRHSAASALANAGVGAEVRKALLGHASDSVHASYVHLEADRLREAVELLPALE